MAAMSRMCQQLSQTVAAMRTGSYMIATGSQQIASGIRGQAHLGECPPGSEQGSDVDRFMGGVARARDCADLAAALTAQSRTL
jgi:hypothetical protein